MPSSACFLLATLASRVAPDRTDVGPGSGPGYSGKPLQTLQLSAAVALSEQDFFRLRLDAVGAGAGRVEGQVEGRFLLPGTAVWTMRNRCFCGHSVGLRWRRAQHGEDA
jgi:hypothetical protein